MSVRKRVSAKSPVRENRTQGSAGGSPSNGRSYPAKKLNQNLRKNESGSVLIVILILKTIEQNMVYTDL